MPREGTARRRREREGRSPAKPGVEGWVHGTKLKFLKEFVEEYQAAAELKSTGSFYSKVAHLYLAKYGYNTKWNEDLAEGRDVADDVDPNENVDDLSPEEATTRLKYFTKLRQKIGVWYNTKHGGSVEKPKAQVTFKTLFDKRELDPPAPVKPRILHFYSRRFYRERIRDRVFARWAAISKRDNPPKEITVRNMVTRECWMNETPAFKAEVELALDKEHQVCLEAFKTATSGEVPSTAEEFDIALNNAAYYLQPFVDAINLRYGMNASLLLCGPIGSRGGRIEMRSVHSGTTNGLVARVWSEFDRAGFDVAQRSFVQFSHQCFTEAECRERSLTGLSMADEEATTVNLETGISGGEIGGRGAGSPSDSSSPTTTPNTTQSTGASGSSTPPPPSTNPPSTTPPSTTPPQYPALIDPSLGASIPPARPEWEGLVPMGDPLVPRNGGWVGNTSIGYDDLFGPTGDYDYNLLPSDMWIGGAQTEPNIGKVLSAELARLSKEDGAEEMTKLRKIRLGRGVSGTAALDMSSEPEDEGEKEVTSDAMARPQPRPLWQLRAVETRRLEEGGQVNGDGGAPPAETRASGAEGYLNGSGARLEEPEQQRAPALETGGPEADPKPSDDDDDSTVAPKNSSSNGVVSGWWDMQDQKDWTPELVKAVEGFARGRTWGGEEWATCVELLVKLERMQGFRDKGQLKAPSGKEERPEEVADFMQNARRWGIPFPVKTVIGPRDAAGSFAERWWKWWEAGQPAARLKAGEKWVGPGEVAEMEWEEMSKRYGRNGVLLYIGGLLWWGEAAATLAVGEGRGELLADWRLAVHDVCGVLSEVVKVKPVGDNRLNGTKGKAAAEDLGTQKTRAPKRKTPDIATEKENEAPRQVFPNRDLTRPDRDLDARISDAKVPTYTLRAVPF
ncbi:hypothetical protein K438DRAFT_1983743 [Mycena galopus ATCC 62051]|nr:hypothetical protein K438DRAFT_1983743 [Mycena galopus ATCC 62051]